MENTNEEKIDRGESAFLSFQVSKKHFSSILLQHNNTSDHPVKNQTHGNQSIASFKQHQK